MIAVVLVAEMDLAVFDGEQTIIGDGHAVGMAAHVVEYLLGSAKGFLAYTTHSRLRRGTRWQRKIWRSCSCWRVEKNCSWPSSKAFSSDDRNKRRKGTGEHAHGKEETAPTGNPARASRQGQCFQIRAPVYPTRIKLSKIIQDRTVASTLVSGLAVNKQEMQFNERTNNRSRSGLRLRDISK